MMDGMFGFISNYQLSKEVFMKTKKSTKAVKASKVITLEEAKKKVEAAQKYRKAIDSNLMNAKTPEETKIAQQLLKGANTRVQNAKQTFKEVKKAERKASPIPTWKKVVGIGALVAATTATIIGGALIATKVKNGDDATDAM